MPEVAPFDGIVCHPDHLSAYHVRDGVKAVLSDPDQFDVWGSGGDGSDGISGGRDASQCRSLTRDCPTT